MTSQDSKKEAPHVCVIGAGVCGLISVKVCLESGLQVTCYERSSKHGGLWNYRPEESDSSGPFESSVMRTTILNTSKELSSFSDFPPPAKVANFMRHNHYMDYINSYAHHFKLLANVRLEHEVLRCEPRWTERSGARIQWMVEVKDLKANKIRVETYDRLMVAVGHHNIPYQPTYPNQQRFKGEVLHSARLKDILRNEKLADKNVLVVGFGNSACDAANDIALVANKCYVSCHRGQWFVSRYLNDGPYDFRIKNRAHHYLTKCMPSSLVDRATINMVEQRVNHKMLGLRPRHKPSELVPAINDLFPYRIYTGGIVLKSAVKTFTETGVLFEGEEQEECQVDVVVLATGYEAKIPFLDELGLGLRSAEHNNEYDLFLNIFAPHFKVPAPVGGSLDSKPTATPQPQQQRELPNGVKKFESNCSGDGDGRSIAWEAIKSFALIGLVQPYGSITVVSELQARYATLVFKGERELPPMRKMLKHMEATRRWRAKRIRSHSRDQLIESYIDYTETLARLMGVRPNLSKLFFTDHKLWRELMFGPCVPYQYRLTGPGHWPGARAAVLSTSERVYCGINEGRNHILYRVRRKRLGDATDKLPA